MMEKIIRYQAGDGRMFVHEADCLHYEKYLKAVDKLMDDLHFDSDNLKAAQVIDWVTSNKGLFRDLFGDNNEL